MNRVPAVALASAAGFAGILALHASSGAPVLTGARLGTPGSTVPRTTAPSTTSSLPPTGTPRAAVGTSEQYGYGVLAVKVAVRGSRIIEVSMAKLQTAEQYSQSLAQQVIPTLHNEVLSTQSAQINGISGATYTSQAYAASVQSALDLLGVK